jgi:hypothetical protein
MPVEVSNTQAQVLQAGTAIGAGFAAGGPAGAGVAAVGVALSQLVQHTARLQGATNENDAADKLIPAFDADLQGIAAAYNNGSADASTCVKACQLLQTQTENYLKAQVGKPGTAWEQCNFTGGDSCCNKACTVGCCLYFSDLLPAINGSSVFGGGGMIPTLQKGSGTVYVPKVYPPSDTSYGNYSRASYNIVLVKPAPPAVVAAPVAPIIARTLGLSTTGSSTATSTSGVPATNAPSEFNLTTVSIVIGLIASLIAIASFLHIGGRKNGG